MKCTRTLPAVSSIVAAFFCATFFCASSYAQFNEPELRSLSLTGAQVGSSIELSVAGTRLDEADRMHFSHPGLHATVKPGEPSPAYGNFVVEVDKDVPPGRYDARVVGRHGVSNPRAFLVSELANVRPASVSHDVKVPTPATGNSIVHATSPATAIDYYTVRVDGSVDSANKTLRIELLAQRLDSRMIGQVKLLSPGGRVLASARGADDVDPTLVVENLDAGDYVIAVNDFLFRSGDDYHYQLAILDGQPRSSLCPSGQLGPESLTASIDMVFSQAAAKRVASPAQKIELPYEGTWTFASGHSENVFEFAATQGDQYSIEVFSQRLGEPTDARFLVQRIEVNEAGATILHDVVRADDSYGINDGVLNASTRDPVALFVAPATASYRLTIQDLDVGDSISSHQQYVLRIAKPSPSFDLAAYRVFPHNDVNQVRPHGSKLARGGMETVRVMVIRRDGWAGAVRVSAEGLPPGVNCDSAIIAANQNQTQLTLIASDDAPAGIASIRVVGHSDDDAIIRQATPVTIAVAKGGNREFTRVRIADELVIGVSDKDIAPVTLRLAAPATEPAKIAEVKKGETLNVAVTVTRRDGGADPITLRPKDLPPGVTAPEITIAGDKSDGTLVLTVTPTAVPGTYSLWSQGETKMKPTPESPPLTVFLSSSTATFRIIEP